jgi:hypothetical protein
MIRTVNIKGLQVYPIFKNGKSAIEHYAKENKCKWLFNEQCARVDPITIFLRKPKDRFVSGVHTYLEYEKRKHKDLNEELLFEQIQNKQVTNEHFMPQYDWLKQLNKYYHGTVILKTVNDLRNLINNREAPRIPVMVADRRRRIMAIQCDLRHDNEMFNNYVGAHLQLDSLMEKIQNAVS